MEPLRIAMISFRTNRAVEILETLADRDIPVAAVILDKGALIGQDKIARARHILKRSGPIELARRFKRRLLSSLTRPACELNDFRSLAPAVHEVADANGEDSIRILRELAPDLIVLGGSRILRPPVINIPRIGVLNAHPGLLPAYRGVDVIHWALHNGDPLGVTVHFVNAGVDTGAIVARQGFEVNSGDTIDSVTSKAERLMCELMADVVAQLIACGNVESIEQDPKAGKQYLRMPPSLRAATEAKLAEQCDETAERKLDDRKARC